MAFNYQKAKMDAFPLMGTVANLESLATESTKKLTKKKKCFQRRISAKKTKLFKTKK